MKVHLGMNTIYATKRWPEPDAWGRQIGQRWGLKHVQFVFDLLDPRSIPSARQKYCAEVKQAAAKYGFAIHNCFIGVAAYTYNYLLHPFKEMRDDALDWCDKAALCSMEMGSQGVGGPIAAASMRDYTNPARREFLFDTLVEGMQSFARIAASHGQSFLIWEPTPVGREMGTSIDQVQKLYDRFNRGSAIPIYLQLDVGHWCGFEQKGKDGDLNAWLAELEGSPRSCIFSKWTGCGTAIGVFPGKIIHRGSSKWKECSKRLMGLVARKCTGIRSFASRMN